MTGGGEADRDDKQVAGQVGDGPAAEHRDRGHRQGTEADQDAGAHVTRQPDRGADREGLPQAVGLNCGFAHHASPFSLCRNGRSRDRRHDRRLDI
jgi:hypothetical protein